MEQFDSASGQRILAWPAEKAGRLRWGVLCLMMFMGTQALAEDAASTQLQQIEARLDAMEKRMTKLDELLKNQGLLSLVQDVDSLRQEISRLKGEVDVNAHELDTQGKRQTDLYQDLDRRLTELSNRPPPVIATVPAPAPAQAPKSTEPDSQAAVASVSQNSPSAAASAPATPDPDPLAESKTYEAALNQFRAANYQGAIDGFKSFAKSYPKSSLASNAQYWIGYSYYALGDYKTALGQQQKLLTAFPQSSKVPDAMLNIARCQEELKQTSSAKKTLEELIAKHAGTNAAAIAAKRLASLK